MIQVSRTRIVAPLLIAGCSLFAASCSERDRIHSYTIEPIRQPEPLTYDVPEEWTTAIAGSFQMALFTIGEGDGVAEASISSAGGTLAMNVNRWRGQLGLPPFGDAEMAAALETVEVDGRPAQRVHVQGEKESIRGVIVPEDGSNWFFKLSGPTGLVDQETDRFDAFVQSVQFAD